MKVPTTDVPRLGLVNWSASLGGENAGYSWGIGLALSNRVMAVFRSIFKNPDAISNGEILT